MGISTLAGRTRDGKQTDETRRRQGGRWLQECARLEKRTDEALDMSAEEGFARPTFGVGAHPLARHPRAFHHMTGQHFALACGLTE